MQFVPRLIRYHLYLLQLENYELLRYWRVVFKKGLIPTRETWRKDVVWTAKLKLIFVGALALHFITPFLFFKNATPLFLLTAFIIFSSCYSVYITVITLVLRPLDFAIKYYILHSAKKKVRSHRQLAVIGIVGSYGKTTMKEVLQTVLAPHTSLITTPENINTPLGISRLILKKLNDTTKLALIEMGEYYRGDIRQICQITPPNLLVVTGVNEAHLERLKTVANAEATIFEGVEYARENAIVVLNADDSVVAAAYKNYINKRTAVFYSAKNNPLCHYTIKNKTFHQDGSGQSFDVYIKDNFLGHFKISLLGEYGVGAVIAALVIAETQVISAAECIAPLSNLKPVEHRLQPLFPPSGVMVIDDSYNGNPAGVLAAVEVLGKFTHRRKIFITPGLVETGNRSSDIHENIGRALAQVCDLVILIKNSVTPHIAEGLRKQNFAEEKIIWFNSATQAHEELKNILKPNDVILFQNDWGDNYI